MYSCPKIKSQLLVCGARQMMYLSGCSTVMSVRHPILLYKIQRHSLFIMKNVAFLLVQVADLVNDLRDLFVEVFCHIFEVVMRLHSWFWM